jgi:hypothetical protein
VTQASIDSGQETSAPELSDEEQIALSEIREFKNPREGWFERITDTVDAPLDKAGDVLFDSTLGERFDRAVAKVVSTLNDAASWTVREDAIFRAFEDAGFDVDRPSHIESVTLEAIREVARNLDKKYQAAAAVEGVGTGAVGVAGAPIDLPLLVGLALRATNEHAAYATKPIPRPSFTRCMYFSDLFRCTTRTVPHERPSGASLR